MKKLLPIILITLVTYSQSLAQIDARLFREPDVSNKQIAFVYSGDIWVVSKEGGTAVRLTSVEGEEWSPKFSPDGTQIAFTANYDGNENIYTLPLTGGIPKRITAHGSGDQILDWHPNGQKLLFASSRESGRQRFNQFFEISVNGGMATNVGLPYGAWACYSPDGEKLAFNYMSRENRTWKRYKGGTAPDLFTYDLATKESSNFTNNNSNDEFPMWTKDKIYYLSDHGPNIRYNIWVYDVNTEKNSQVTKFTDWDVHFSSMGPTDLVFEAGGKLYLMDLATQAYKEIIVKVITDQITLLNKEIDASENMQWFDISPDGKRVVTSARGEIFTLPAKEGVTRNLTQSDGAADRTPSWSPDGKKIAFWSDKNKEYQLQVYDIETSEIEELTNYQSGFRYQLFWSPDNKKIAFIDHSQDINYFDFTTKRTVTIDKELYLMHGGLSEFTVSWSSDSKWLAYGKSNLNRSSSIYLFNTDTQQKHQVTSGYYNDSRPTFDPDNNYLFYLTGRSISPEYSDLDNSFIYPNSNMIAAVPLTNKVKSPIAPKNDEVEISAEKEEDKKEEKGKKSKSKDKDENEVASVKIDLDDFESRAVLLPVEPGNFNTLEATSGKLVFQKSPNTGSSDDESPVYFYDLEERKVKSILSDADGIEIAANGEKMAAMSGGKIAIVDIAESQSMSDFVAMNSMKMTINPKNEWKQIFWESWRLQRDYFYDADMHGLDWQAIGDQYYTLIEQSVTRWDVNFVLGELIGELNASHTYRGGGDLERGENKNIGYLGIDWSIDNGKYRIKKIIKGASWDAEVRSPLDESGIAVNEGDYILAVNGVPLTADKEVYSAFQGLANQTVELTINSTPSTKGAQKVLVKTLGSESRLRHLEWIESNRKTVAEATDDRVGYIYVRSTGVDGQNELVRQFMAQFDKEGLIIDERFNSGGQIPDRFIELLNRKPLAYWAVRDGKTWQWPPAANFGPKAMLINGWSGSGGDAFPDYFRKTGLGPLIGTRTWGGLIGISGVPSLIDGGIVTVPTFRMYNPDGTWFKEGYGVDPDIEVKENPGELGQGTDAQLQKAIEWINNELKDYEGMPARPAKEKR